jgi:DNA-directed RNA polymerase sigma subunit (sigma70/sigma32)
MSVDQIFDALNLSEKDELLLRLRMKDVTLEKIGETLGITKEAVRLREKVAFQKAKKRLNSMGYNFSDIF